MIEIIPAIDLMDGRCVRLSQGDFELPTTYSSEPLEMARRFETAGLTRLHIVDLDGARKGKLANLPVLESIAKNTRLAIDFGGGIKTSNDVQAVFDAGAAMVNIGSTAVTTPDTFFEWVDRYGSEKVLLGADIRDGHLTINGWQTVTSIAIVPFLLEYFAMGVRRVFVTDVGVDGMLTGPALDTYRQIREAVPDLHLIASGGVRGLEDIRALETIGSSGVIVGKAIYEDQIDLEDLREFTRSAGPGVN
jgi:phosphoribosylformimino-5-aminoimidazole carboxamide ribotide isomerase